MYPLSCVEGYQFPRPGDVYILEIVSVAAGLASISSKQELSLCNPLRLSQGPLRTLQTLHGNITSLAVLDAAASVVCTAGENGTLSVWDLRTDAARVQTIQASSGRIKERGVLICEMTPRAELLKLRDGRERGQHHITSMCWCEQFHSCGHRAQGSSGVDISMVSTQAARPVALAVGLIPDPFSQGHPGDSGPEDTI